MRATLWTRRRPLWVLYPSLVAAVGALYLAGPLNAGPVFNLMGASSAVAVAIGARRHRPRGVIAWYLIATGLVLFVAGDLLAYNYQRLFGAPLPFPSIADPFYLAIYPCLVAGLLKLQSQRHAHRDDAALLDAAVVAIGIGTVSWVYLMAPYAHDGGSSWIAKLTSLAYPVMDLAVLAVGVRLVLRARQRGRSAELLAAGLVTLLATDSIYGWTVLHGGYTTGGLLDVGWIAFYVLTGTAALHPSMRLLSEPAQPRSAPLTRRRLALLAAASMLAPGLQLVRALLDQPREPVISIMAAAIFLLVLARMATLVRVQEAMTEETLRRRYETRLAALVRNASDVVSIVGTDGRITYLSPSGGRLLGRSTDELQGQRWIDFVHAGDVAELERFLVGLGPACSGSAEYRLLAPDGSSIDVETLATNLRDDGTVEGIVLNTRDVSERKALERRLAHQASHDGLTGLANRSLLGERVALALARRRRHGPCVGLVVLDLDDFKTMNDSLGHAAGDAVLRETAARLKAEIRATDTAARLGGDEFAVLLDGVEDEAEAIGVVERLIAALARPVVVDGRELLLAASAGIAFAVTGAEGVDELLRSGDMAMYRAKEQGKGRYAVSEPTAPARTR